MAELPQSASEINGTNGAQGRAEGARTHAFAAAPAQTIAPPASMDARAAARAEHPDVRSIAPDQPEGAGRHALALVHGVHPRPEDLGRIRGVAGDHRHGAPEQGAGRQTGELQRRDAEPEQQDQEQGRHAAQSVDVDDGEHPQRGGDRSVQGPHHRQQKSEQHDEEL